MCFWTEKPYKNAGRLFWQFILCVLLGYKYMFDEKLVTVWSAPNYCYRCGNIAAVLAFSDSETKEAKLFRAVPDSERVIPSRTTTPYFLWWSILIFLEYFRTKLRGQRWTCFFFSVCHFILLYIVWKRNYVFNNICPILCL